ncbi:hypothetical protein [Mycobacterium vicinigordonae]|uniref:Membrane glycine and proline rich protein n=1 Tax=Mycobacterium vicinigordonae TaxID=1719132 RepID=A0A7D6DWF8_9MYCO|nr:hypothetical protein [Mycobacterium vicinigordonae]QLL06447.1 hypothetical protein H0P51_22275 [Mycobacterium vicinigordonae]
MTVPPGGPYGQDPYGTNPYGQQPHWSGQPQEWSQQPQQWGQQPPGQSAEPTQAAPYSYPPAAPYGTDPYGNPGYPPQQFTQPGQQPPGWPGGPGGPYPPPGPPKNSKLPWLIVGGIAVLGAIVLVVVLVVSLNSGKSSPSASPSTTTTAEASGPGSGQQTATDCTPNVSGGAMPSGDTVSAGKLSFPANLAAGWQPYVDDQNPNLIDGAGLAKEVAGGNQWMMQVEVAVTNFVTSMDVSAQASKLLDCVAVGPGYNQVSPSLGPKTTSSMTVDGLKAAKVQADVTIGDASRGVKGDTVTIVAVDTKPVTIFLGAVPIGDSASQAIVDSVIAALKVTKT